ncbi:MAG: hypothetical protein KF866_09610 [Phycisphaeraceae bacterium]|nr:hypothetical protein [Phycisphaeraceae bacterium]MCW5754755.1 hypothetical protein [Phycisphaeraceae bacterium]
MTSRNAPWLDRARTFILVTVVAALVWVFAEGESLRSGERQDVRLRFSSNQEMFVRPIDMSGNAVIRRIRIDGATNAVGEVLRAIGQEIVLERGRDFPGTPGEYTIELREALKRHPALSDRGVTIREVEPELVRVRVTELQTVQARVIFPGISSRDHVQAEARPSTVSVTLPRSVAQELPQRLEIPVDLTPERLSELGTDGAAELRDIPLDPPESLKSLDGFRINPSSIAVYVTRVELRGRKTLPVVAVHLRIPAVSYGKYEIEVDPSDETLDNVVISGPVDLLAQVGPGGQYQPLAVVELSPSELDGAIDQALRSGSVWATIERLPALIRLPPGLGDDWDADDRLITIRVRRRVGSGELTTPPGGE